MSSLLSAIDELAAEDLGAVDDAVLEADLVTLAGARRRLDAELTRRVGEFDGRGLFAQEGFVSAAAWLRDRCRLAWGTARRLVGLARALRRMPLSDAAYGAGDIGTSHVALLVRAARVHPRVFPVHERVLVDAAAGLDPGGMRKVVQHWIDAADPDRALADTNRLWRRRRLHVSETLGGMVRIDGDLDPESGHIVLTAIRSLAEPAAKNPTDGRRSAQRRADALVDICRDFLDHGETPVRSGVKPHLSVIVDLETLQGVPGHRAHLDDGTPVHPETLRRWACDARISRVITRGRSLPLDVGRVTRTVTWAQRLALIIRDGGCVWPGCDRPPRFCDVHHRIPWADGGPTDLDHLALLCRPHHRKVHEEGHRLPGPVPTPPARRQRTPARPPASDQRTEPHPELGDEPLLTSELKFGRPRPWIACNTPGHAERVTHVTFNDAEVYRKYKDELMRFAAALVGPTDASAGNGDWLVFDLGPVVSDGVHVAVADRHIAVVTTSPDGTVGIRIADR